MPMSQATTAIRVSGLSKSYRKTQALDGLDFEIPPGKVAGFLGPNGAGKTTTFRTLLGLTRPDGGAIEVLGMSVPHELNRITKKVGAIVEEPGLIKAHSGLVNMQIAADTLGFGHERIPELIDFVGLTGDAGRKAEQYSKGMRQRLALAAAMIADPDLFLLDEPLDGLDPAGQHAFRARLKNLAEEGKTVVVSSHDLADIEALADYVVVINRGRLVTQGPLESLLDGGNTRVVVADTGAAEAALSAADIKSTADGVGLLVESEDGSEIIRILSAAGIYPSEVRPERTTLESVFLGMTEEFGS
jgi:ABC-type multidrug transport system ATPase subunit